MAPSYLDGLGDAAKPLWTTVSPSVKGLERARGVRHLGGKYSVWQAEWLPSTGVSDHETPGAHLRVCVGFFNTWKFYK